MCKKNKVKLIITIVIALCFVVLPQAAVILLALCLILYIADYSTTFRNIYDYIGVEAEKFISLISH